MDLDDFPEYRDRLVAAGHSATYKRPVCKGPIKVKDLSALQKDIDNMKAALATAKVTEGFMNAVSPGTIAVFQPNEYYPSHEAYLGALAYAMREEYEMIVKSGLLLQLDCPDLAMGRHTRFKKLTDAEFLRNALTESVVHRQNGNLLPAMRQNILCGKFRRYIVEAHHRKRCRPDAPDEAGR